MTGNQNSGLTANHKKLVINTDVLYEESFVVTSYRRSTRLRNLLNDVVPATIWRWARGRRSPVTGKMCYLEVAFNEGSRLVTSVEAYRRFLERMNGTLPPNSPPKDDESPGA